MLFYGQEIEEKFFEGRKVVTGVDLKYILNNTSNKKGYSDAIRVSIQKGKLKNGVDYIKLSQCQFKEIFEKRCSANGCFLLFYTGAKYFAKTEEQINNLNKFFKIDDIEQLNLFSLASETETKESIPVENNEIEPVDIVTEEKNDPVLEETSDISKGKKYNRKKRNIEKKEEVDNTNDLIIEHITNEMENKSLKENKYSSFHQDCENINAHSNMAIEPNSSIMIANIFSGMMNNFMEMHKQILMQQNEMNVQFRNEMKELFYHLSEQNYNQSNKELHDKEEKNKEEAENFQDRVSIVDENEPLEENCFEDSNDVVFQNSVMDYYEWKKGINRAADLIVELNGKYKNKNQVFAECYKLLTKEYGIVWDQEKKEFYKENKRGPVNTLELAFYIETKSHVNRNLVISKLNTLYGEEKKELYCDNE